MRKIAIAEAAIIPPITVEPRIRRAAAPERLANHNGRSPKMKAKEGKTMFLASGCVGAIPLWAQWN